MNEAAEEKAAAVPEADVRRERARLWAKGDLIWYLRNDQIPVFEFLFSGNRFPFLECARRYGKTTVILIYVIMRLRQNPGWICRWTLPEKAQARKIVMPEMDKIQADCPERYKFKFQTTDSVYIGPGRSRIYLYGVDKDKGRNLRGETSNIVVADEYGFWSDPTVLSRVMRPTLFTTRGQQIIASTPSDDPAHPYYQLHERAKRLERLLVRTVYQNESLTQEQIQEEMDEAGGKDSYDWRREYECEHITDPALRVIPEYNEDLHDLPDDWPLPRYFDAYTCGDNGVDDNTVLLFGYYDFDRDWVVIEHELVKSNATTPAIIRAARAIEKDLWMEKAQVGPRDVWTWKGLHGGSERTYQPYLRMVDADKQVLLDMCAFTDEGKNPEGYSVGLPEKQDRIAAIRFLNRKIQEGKFRIKKRCKVTRRQLKVGQWKDIKHKDFERSEDEELKHLDGIAAAVYFNRSVIRTRNPYPPNTDISIHTHFIPEDHQLNTPSNDVEALKTLFKR